MTIKDCKFLSSNSSADVVGMRFRQSYNISVEDCEGDNLHSIMWATGVSGIKLDGVRVTNSKSGISVGTSTNVVIENSNLTADAHGIRADGSVVTTLSVKTSTINAVTPIFIRNTTADYNVALVNTTLNKSGEYDVIFTNGKDELNNLAIPTGKFSITGAESYNVYPIRKVSTADELENAVEANVPEIILTDDIDLTGTDKSVVTELLTLKINGNGNTINLPEAMTGTVTVNEMKDVTISSSENSDMRFVTDANSNIENVTIEGFTFEFETGSGQQNGAFTVINKDAKIENLVIENSTIIGDSKKNSYGIFGNNENASIVVRNCKFQNLGYAIQTIAGGGYNSLTVEKCTFDNIISWAIMPQYGFSGDMTISSCTFNKTTGGLIKTGAFNGSTFTFTNNIITNSTGHDGSDSKWFDVNASSATKVISGNTKDGIDWTPGATEGLK